MLHRRIKKKQTGLTLTEMAIVMMIIGVIMGAIWVAAAAVYGNSRLSTTQKQILEIVQRTRAVHGVAQGLMLDMAVQGAAGAVTMAQVGVIPSDMVDNPATPTAVQHLWGGNVTFSAMNTSVNGDSFRIGLVDVPQWVCADIMMRITGGDRDPGMLQVGTSNQMYNTDSFPLTVVETTTACPGETNTLLFEFRLKS